MNAQARRVVPALPPPERAPQQQCAEYREKARKRSHLEAFSRDFLTSLASALNDGSRTPLVQRLHAIRDATCSDEGAAQTPAQAILRARQTIGRDNDAYLQCGLMVLWCGDDMENDLAHTLYPSSLTLGARPERPGYGEERVVEKLLEQTTTQLRTLRTFVESVAPRRIAYLLSIPEVARYVVEILRTEYVLGRLEGLRAIKALLLPQDFDDDHGLLTFVAEGALPVATHAEGQRQLEEAIRTLMKQEDGVPSAALSALLGTLCDRTEAQGLVERLVSADDGARAPWQLPEGMSADDLCRNARRALRLDGDGNDTDPLPYAAGDFKSLNRALLWMHDAHLWQHCHSDAARQWPPPPSVPMAVDVRPFFAPDVVEGPEDGVRAAFVNARSVRMVTSLAINLYRGGACDPPPHLLPGAQIRPAYRVPHADATDLLRGAAAVEPHPRPMGVHDKVGTAATTTTAFRRVVSWVDHAAEPGRPTRVLWTPTRADDEGPRIGGLSLTPMSLHVSYATYLAKAVESVPGPNLEDLWAAAVFKLEMMPSLTYIYERVARGDDVQTAISSPNVPSVEARTSAMLVESAINPLVHVPAQLEGNNALVQSMCGIVHSNERPDAFPADAAPAPGFPAEYLNEGALQLRALSSADFGQRIGGDGNPNPLGAQLSRVPVFASPDGAVELATRLRQLHGTKRRLEAQRDAYQSALDDVRGGRDDAADYGRAAGESALPDADDRGRRDAIWQDALRELSIGGDRLYTFLKVMAGTLHEDVQNIIKLEDRSMEANHRMYREQRRDALRDSATFGQRIVDSVLSSVFKQSKLKVDLDLTNARSSAAEAAASLVVVSDEGIERVNELASGTSGLGFLEASSQLRQYMESRRGSPVALKTLLGDLREILDAHRSHALRALQASQDQSTRSSMEYLAEPKNSLVIRLKNETFAAVRTAYDLLRVELRGRGWSDSSIPTAFQCMEGPDASLCNQFAQLAAYQLSHGRTFSSSSAIYVGVNAARMNMQMLRTALAKMVNRVAENRRRGGRAV
jgi:hypothetical protein